MILNQPENPATTANLVLNNKNIEIVEDFKYLGSYVGSTDHDVHTRIGLAWAAYRKLDKIFSSKKTKLDFKVRLFNASCLSILLYGCETWILNEDLKEDLDIFARKCYRKMLGITQSDTHMSNETLYSIINSEPIRTTINQRQMSFTGHCLRMETDEPANIYALYESKVKPTNRLGRPRKSYIQEISSIIYSVKDIVFSVEEIARMAKEGKGAKWKDLYCRSRAKKPPDKSGS